MPPVTKQSPTKPTPVPKTPPPESDGDGMKCLVYGRGKTGKTRLGCTFPKPLLLIGTEDGTKSVATGRSEKFRLRDKVTPVYSLSVGGKGTGIDFVRLQESAQVDELAEYVKRGDYRSVVFDTAGGLQDMILKEVLGLDDVPVQKSWGMGDQRSWGVVGMQFKERMRVLLSPADTHGTKVFVIAHERNFKDEGTDSDLVSPTVGAALTPSAAGWLNAACDYIGQAFIRPQTVRSSEKVGNQVVEMRTKTGKVEYCLRVGPHEVFLTGFRVPDGVAVPDVIVSPSYDKIVQVIHGGKV